MGIFSGLFRPTGSANTKRKKVTVDIDDLFKEMSLDDIKFDAQDEGFNNNVDDYTLLDFVAIPPGFKIESFFGLREHAGIVEHESVDINQVKKLCIAVSSSPVFASLNNHRLSVSSCLYFLSLLDELNLIVRSIPNPLRIQGDTYKSHINDKDPNRIFVRGQVARNVNFIIVNVCQLLTQDIIDDAIDTANKAAETQLDLDIALTNAEKID
jgi:hypothetical protein